VFLKRIVLQGFKSFADRTEFDFGAGRTAVVGPNGCGKSNVLDAVRWVLGEQSAKTLRGKKMLDVVFAGSRTRKPGAFAEVLLTFDNARQLLACDDKEVIVGRLLYRNGDSEYRINGKRCRMKDIRELLLDTGVGVDAYSVIEQGRVDALLQASPTERREIFEEAAGISRYRMRRAEAQRKLDRTQQNLLRLNDVIEELEKRLRSVKIAAGKARNFQEYDARLREQRSAFSLAEYHELEQALTQRQAERRELADQLSGLRAGLAKRDADAAELEHAAQALDENIQYAEEKLLEVETEQSAVTERIVQGERRLSELAQTRDRRLAQTQDAVRRTEELRARISDDEIAVQTLVEVERRESARIEDIETRRTATVELLDQARASLENERTESFEAARQSSRLHNETENLLQRRERLEARLSSMGERRRQVESQQAELERREEDLKSQVDLLEQQSNELASQTRAAEAQLQELVQRIEGIDARLGELKEGRSGLLSQLVLLEDLEKRQEGIDQGARWLLEWRDGEPESSGAVVGLVADVLHIDDPRVASLEAVLARFEHQIVVRDGYVFLAELNRRDEPPGPASVIALDRLTADTPAVSYAEAPGFIARASDWVRCADEYRSLAERLLGRVIVVDALERALALAQGSPEGYMFVTLGGDTVESDGRITVGVSKSVVGLISRKTRIRRLQSELDELETLLERTTRERGEIEEQLSDGRLRRDALMQQIAAVQKQHAGARTELLRVRDTTRHVARETEVLHSESSELERSLSESTSRLEQVETERDAVETARLRHEANIHEFEEQFALRESAVGTLAQELTAARIEASRAAERSGARRQALQELHDRLEKLAEENERARHETAEAAEKIEQAEAEGRANTARREELNEQCESQRAAVVQRREERQALRQEIENCGAAARETRGEIDAFDERYRECEVLLRETEVRKEGLVSRVFEELSLDLVELYASYEHAAQDWDAIRQEIETLRGKIARLGNVNLDALAELAELTPRFENLIAQRADLNESIERLEKLIAELDEESRVRFSSCFEQVRDNFLELFRKLFGGGKADIILEDPENPLECGIEIIARPPGKEPRSISLLSGGEKTMTAVALLFAVFKRKPSPFAILDEVDAALDESNIDRFNNMLDEFLAQTQFILITHSKRTMQCADVLYGVTMEEPGVSKHVSVRFDDRVETPHVA